MTRPTSTHRLRRAQGGVVMIVALMLLAALTLAGVALIRSVSTTNVVAGNLAFRQAATRAADQGIETASQWLLAQDPLTTLRANQTVSGYVASTSEPAAGTAWSTYFDTVLLPLAAPPIVDASGNTIEYVIQRLCSGAGDPATVQCTVPPGSRSTCTKDGGSCSGGAASMLGINAATGAKAGPSEVQPKVYYRITARSSGPRNTRSYVQSIVSI